MSNIVLVRIDDRLIHGQIMTSWVKYTRANTIVIVDDGVANDPFMEKVLKMAVPSEIKVDVFSTDKAIEILKLEDHGSKEIIILAKYPKTIHALIEGGVDIKDINMGGMGASVGRKSLYKNISVSPEEREILKKMVSIGKNIFMQIVPDDKKVEIDKYL